MSKALSKEHTSNDIILQLIKAKPKSKINLEQKDSESLNTMDYYKEDSSNKNSLIEEIKLNANKLLYNSKKIILFFCKSFLLCYLIIIKMKEELQLYSSIQ